MAEIKKIPNINGNYEYYKDKYIDMRVNNLAIKIWKPYRYPMTSKGQYYVSKNPRIEISSNMATIWSAKDIAQLNEAILFAVNLLNSEGNCLIDSNNWGTSKLEPVPINEIPDGFKEAPLLKYRLYPDLGGNTLYRVRGGRKWLYLGHGYVYKVELPMNNKPVTITTMNSMQTKRVYLAIYDDTTITQKGCLLEIDYKDKKDLLSSCKSVEYRKKSEESIGNFPDTIYIYRCIGKDKYNPNSKESYLVMINDIAAFYSNSKAEEYKKVAEDILKRAGVI